MNVVQAGFTIEDEVDGDRILQNIERYGRTCYKSEAKIAPGSAAAFIRKILASGHESVIEHEKVTVRIVCDRGVSHEIVRHRIASYSQESTRYCNYGKCGAVAFVAPCFWSADSREYAMWASAMLFAEAAYLDLLLRGASPQQARSVLPNSLKTEIVCTFNLREWRHFFKLRTSLAAHPQMREIAVPLLREFQNRIPGIFDDIEVRG